MLGESVDLDRRQLRLDPLIYTCFLPVFVSEDRAMIYEDCAFDGHENHREKRRHTGDSIPSRHCAACLARCPFVCSFVAILG